MRFPTAVLETIELEGRVARDVTVAVCNGCGGRSAGGLLGLDVQAAWGLELDLRNQRVRFVDCDEDE